MGGARKAPRARDRILGARLRAIRREQTTLSLEEAAALAQWSPSTMSRIETGKRHISPEDAVALMRSFKLETGVFEMRWLARMRRQQILGTLDYSAFIGESALRTPFGGREAMRGQLRALMEAPGRGIGVRVLAEHRPTFLVTHSWLLMEFPNTNPVVTIEATEGSVFLHDEAAGGYLPLVAELDRLALSASASQALIREIHEEFQ